MNFNFPGNINALNNALGTVNPTNEPAPKVLDFSQWEAEAPPAHDLFHDLGLDGAGVTSLLNQQYGLSETLKASFPFLTNKNGSLKALLKASFAFEHLGRDTSYEALGATIGCNCTSAYQYGLKLREAYEEAFGLALTSTKEGLHLVTVNELQLTNERMEAVINKHLVPLVMKISRQAQSLTQCGQQFSLASRNQALLTAMLTNTEED